ncbi:MAG: MoaD/ThiS family protein [Promethearchaeota archaeon]
MVNVKLYAGLRKFMPSDTELGDFFQYEFQGSTVSDLLKTLGIKEVHVQNVMINGERAIDFSETLAKDDLVSIFPPIGGG